MSAHPNRQQFRPGQRFEVFRRDNFTCTYCGSKAPDVRLVVDHVVPVASGGRHRFDNFTTACELCNMGKSDKSLEPRTDEEWERAMVLNNWASFYFNPNVLVAMATKVRREKPAPSIEIEHPEPYGYAGAMADWELETLEIARRRLVVRILRILDDPSYDFENEG